MGKLKYTHKEVKQFFQKKNMELLSKEYKGNEQKLEYKCLICGYVGTKILYSLLRGSGCPSCAGLVKPKYNEVKQIFKERNMELLSKKYESNSQKLEYKCLVCGYIGTKRLSSLLNDHECPSCAGMLRRTYDEVKLIFKEKNMELLSKGYKNTQQKLKYKCLICGYIGKKTLSNLLRGKRCPSCAGKITRSYNEVKLFFKEKNMKLLSKKYKNTQQKLKYKCLICGYIGTKRLGSLLMGCGCPSCARVLKLTYKQVKKLFKEKNLKLLSKEYKNYKQKLKFECLICGYVGTKSLKHLSTTYGCKRCGYEITAKKQKFTYEKVEKLFKEKNLKLLSKEYENNQQRLEYECLLCGHTGLKSLGHLAHNCNWYNRNLTEEDRINRRITTEDKKWAKEIKKIYDYTCQKCGKRGGIINSHHKNAKKGFPEQRHLISNGIVFCEDCHKKFHKKYGKGNNTEIQTELFLNEKGIKYA